MDKSIIITGLNYWRTQAPEALFDLGFGPQEINRVLRETDFKETESTEKLGEKFQACLREFARAFKQARRLDVYNAILSKALEAGYEKAGALRGAGVDEFLEYVVERDRLIGLQAGGSKISDWGFTYWIEDMFLPLCKDGSLSLADYESISTNGYLQTKINYFLPDPQNWRAEMTISPFDSDRTEWKIYTRNRPSIRVKIPEKDIIAAAL